MRTATALIITLVLGSTAACSTSPSTLAVQPIDGQVSGQCHLDSVRGARGLAASAQTLERARVDSDSLQVRTVMAAGSPPAGAQQGGDRLTVTVGRNNAISGLHCG